ncbi:hypothetical protein GGR51DRAFT_141422 [Nemania sp. FL0031]|nr:hypothetical protein GGR51DRAFT_141422 [Nemania sp. FL0031]
MDQASEPNTTNLDGALLEVRDSAEDISPRPPDTDRQSDLIEKIANGKFNVDLGRKEIKARFLSEYGQWFMDGEHGTLMHAALKAIYDKSALFNRFKSLFTLIIEQYPYILKVGEKLAGETALHYAIQHKLSDAVEYLCHCVTPTAAAAAISCRDEKKANCLHAAIKCRLDIRTIKYLISACKASAVLDVDDSHLTPLHYAVDDAYYTNREIDDGSRPLEIVRLLVEKNDAALLRLDASGRTPYLLRAYQRESKILKVVGTSEASTEEQNGSDTTASTDSPDDWVLVGRDPVAEFILSYSLRKFTRRDIAKCLYHPGQERQVQLDLSGLPLQAISRDYLDGLSEHLQFESILRIVRLPHLTIETSPNSAGHMIRANSSRGADPVLLVFNWLRENGVERIIEVVVVDNEGRAYPDSSIKKALGGFDIRVWNWGRLDLSSDVIYSAAPLAEEIYLYSTGNNAALVRWASPKGLIKFTKLKSVNVSVQKSREDFGQLTQHLRIFSNDINAQTHGRVKVSYTIVDELTLAAENMGKYIQAEYKPWSDCILKFGTLLRRNPAFRESRPVKIAVLDDGVDASLPIFKGRIAFGESFCYDVPGPLGNYFVSSTGHGTHMCTIIATLSPNVRLYIAKLGSRIVDSKVVSEAIDWATHCGVDVIFIGCGIIDRERCLDDAICRAKMEGIAIFCAANDGRIQGNEDLAEPHGCIRIRAASEDESELARQGANVHFLVPGRKKLAIRDETSGTIILSEVGNSIATATAAGLAGFLLSCSWFVGNDKDACMFGDDAIGIAFNTMVEPNNDRFPRVQFLERRFLDELKSSRGLTLVESGYNITEMEWDDTCTEAFRAVMKSLRMIFGA